MNKIKLYIVPNQEQPPNYNHHQYNADLINKNITNTIKKFSSERSLFFSNLNDAIIDCNYKWSGEDQQRIQFKGDLPSSEGTDGVVIMRRNQPGSKKEVNRHSAIQGSNKGWKESLLKRCKSTKELFHGGILSNNSNSQQHHHPKNCNELKQQSFRNSHNLDDFDKYYLFSGNRKNIVKELRKNFENQPKSFVEVSNCANNNQSKTSSNAPAGPNNISSSNNASPKKTKRFFDIFSSGKSHQQKSQYQQQVKESYEQRKSNTQLNEDGNNNRPSIDQFFLNHGSACAVSEEESGSFYLHDKYGMRSRQNLNSVFYGANNATYLKPEDSTDPEDVQRNALASKVLEKYGDRVRETESFSKFLSHTQSVASSTPKLKAITKLDPDFLNAPKNNSTNVYGPRRNSTSNLDDLQRCEVIIENHFESLPPPLNPTFQQQYLNAKKQLECEVKKKSSPTLQRKNLKSYFQKSIETTTTGDHLKKPNLEEDLYILNNNQPRKFTHIKSDSANNVSDFDVEYRGELGDFVDPKWCSSASINNGLQTYYRQFGRIRKVKINLLVI